MHFMAKFGQSLCQIIQRPAGGNSSDSSGINVIAGEADAHFGSRSLSKNQGVAVKHNRAPRSFKILSPCVEQIRFSIVAEFWYSLVIIWRLSEVLSKVALLFAALISGQAALAQGLTGQIS